MGEGGSEERVGERVNGTESVILITDVPTTPTLQRVNAAATTRMTRPHVVHVHLPFRLALGSRPRARALHLEREQEIFQLDQPEACVCTTHKRTFLAGIFF